jgi:hypothetical protein
MVLALEHLTEDREATGIRRQVPAPLFHTLTKNARKLLYETYPRGLPSS